MEDVSVVMMVSYAIQLVILALGIYYFGISIFSFIPKREKPIDEIKNRDYAVIVAAHNEEKVIKNLIDSLNRQNYPKDRYEIFVIADNCTDQTAAVASAAGASVYERTDTQCRGKGFALEWMFEKIYDMERKFDSIVIFDADNVVSPDFLKNINLQHNRGYKVIQGYIDSKNPTDSWISYSYSIAFWTVNKLFQQSRYNLGLGCQLCGTGFSVDVSVLRDIGWGATCLTEDMEFTMKLGLNDIKVAWANDAVVYDEKPITMSQSWKQRVRWMQGHADVACRFCGKLVKKSVKEHKVAPFDCAVYLLQPLRIIVNGIITVMAWVETVYPGSKLVLWGLVPDGIWNVIVIMQFLWLPFILIIEKKADRWLLFRYIAYAVYSLTWVPIAIIGVAKRRNKEWFHTQHTRTITINEIK